MSQKLDITNEQKELILELLEKFLPHNEAWAYGSRVKFTSNDKSDLDMVVFADKSQRLQVADLREAFAESNIPFCVDLFTWHEIPEQFKKNIMTKHVVLKKGNLSVLSDR